MISFTETVIMGNVIRKLSIISIMSPQTRISACVRGIPKPNVIIIKIRPIRMSDPSLRLAIPSGHKPTNSKPRRFSLIAHSKSLKRISF